MLTNIPMKEKNVKALGGESLPATALRQRLVAVQGVDATAIRTA
jgi:hypothetical protein